jgi:hypothetical protein
MASNGGALSQSKASQTLWVKSSPCNKRLNGLRQVRSDEISVCEEMSEMEIAEHQSRRNGGGETLLRPCVVEEGVGADPGPI